MTQENGLAKNGCVIKNARCAYPSLISPSPDLNGNDKYSCVLLIPKDYNVDNIKAALRAAIEIGKAKKWGGVVPGDLHIPLQDGDLYYAKQPEKRQHYKGQYYINAKQDPEWGKPTVVDQYGLKSELPSTINSGDYVAAVIEFFPYKQAGGNGLSATPKVVQKLRDGEPIGGGISESAALAALGLDASVVSNKGNGEASSQTTQTTDDALGGLL